MDELDLRLLRAMGLGPPGALRRDPDALKPAHLARVVGLTPQGVKDRLAKLEEAGVLEGYVLAVNPGHVGLEFSLSLWRGDEGRKAAAFAELEAVAGVFGLLNFFGPDFYAFLVGTGPEDLERTRRLVASFTGGARVLDLYRHPFPRVERALTHLDWRIAAAMMRDARRPLPEVAEEVGVTTKTVRTRLDRMLAEGSVVQLPVIDRSRLAGVAFAHLLVRLAPGDRPAAARGVEAALEHRLLYAPLPPSRDVPHFDAGVYAFSPAELEELRARAARVPGVEGVQVLVPCGAQDNPALLVERVMARLRETAPAA